MTLEEDIIPITTSSSSDRSHRLYCGDSATILKDHIESESVDCVITSPDYWQLRGDTEILQGEMGLEETYSEYLAKLTAIFNQIHRVMKPTATLFIVINDSYNTPKLGNTNGIPTSRGSGTVKQKTGMHEFGTSGVNKKLQPGIMAGSALLIPWRLAISMVDSGRWCLKNACIWYKRNGQPNTSPNRFGLGDYEPVLFFTKQSTGYYFKAPMEPSKTEPGKFKFIRQVWDIPTQPSKSEHYSQFPPSLVSRCIEVGCPPGGTVLDPFMGSGTTGLVALQQSKRRFVGIDIIPKFVEIAKKRLEFQEKGTLDFYG